MNNKIASDDGAKKGRDATADDARPGIFGRTTGMTCWRVSAAAALVAPAALVAEDAAEPIARMMACIGNGSIMALAASANAFTMIP